MKAAMKVMKVGGMRVGPKLKKKAVLVGGARRLKDAWGTIIKEPVKAKGNAKAKAKAKQGMKVVVPSSGTDIKRRPAAAGHMGAQAATNAENMGAKVAKQHGLEGVEISPYDRRKFHETMQSALQARGKVGKVLHGVPEEILDEYEQLSDKKLKNPGKFAAMGLLRKAWKHDPSWGHPMIREKVNQRQSKTLKDIKKAVIWPRMVTKLGGEAQAVKALKDGDIFAITDPNNVNKKLYIMREFVDERMWASMRERSGEQAIMAALDETAPTAEAMMGQLFSMHEEMPEIMDYIDDSPAMPEVMGFQTAMVPTQYMAPLPRGSNQHAPETAWGPSTQSAVSRLLTFISSTQTRLRGCMGGSLTENQKKFMAQYMTDDLKALDDWQKNKK